VGVEENPLGGGGNPCLTLIGMRQGTFTSLVINFGIGFCQLNLYQKFPNFFGGEN